jgi:antitoxin PrlF
MLAALEIESTLTDRYQTTVPETVRRALQLQKRDKLHYAIQPSGEVLLTRFGSSGEADPVLGSFLNFLSQSIASHPDQIKLIDTDFVQRIQGLVSEVEVNLDAPLSAADE